MQSRNNLRVALSPFLFTDLKKVIIVFLSLFLLASLSSFIRSALIPSALASKEYEAAHPGKKVYYFLNDHLGSVDKVLDSDGNVVEERDFLPYGEERVSESYSGNKAKDITDHKFTGKELDDETGLYYYGARYYDPLIGRFISQDPWEGNLMTPQTLNKYSYVVNNPVRYVDETGMIPKDASFLGKFVNAVTYGNFGKGNGWLANSARAYAANPTKSNLKTLQNNQATALNRLAKDAASFFTSFTDETWDPVTTKRIETLDSRLQIPATDFINEVEEQENVTLRTSDVYRTFEEQDDLYAKGRTKPGPVVTNAKGGESYHNYGLAFDVVEIKDRQLTNKPISEKIANIGKSFGFEWGGNWPELKDFPHFQMTFGQSIQQLYKKITSDNEKK